MDLNQSAITLTHITKRYGDLTAVEDLNLEIRRGEILGFLGPNGAGKTTTIRILTGFLRPTAGTVRLLGHDMTHERDSLAARASLGYMPDVAGLDATATGEWLLDDLAALQGQAPVDRVALIEAMEINKRDLRRPMGRLSRGTRQKINIVQGLQHRPDLLILDEPTEGLDPLAKRALFGLLTAARDRGATLFFSSHILSEVEDLSDRVALIRRGRLVAIDEIAALRANLHRRVDLLPAEPAGVESRLRALPGISDIRQRDGRWLFATTDLPALLQLLADLQVLDVVIQPPSLEDVFMTYYREAPNNG